MHEESRNFWLVLGVEQGADNFLAANLEQLLAFLFSFFYFSSHRLPPTVFLFFSPPVNPLVILWMVSWQEFLILCHPQSKSNFSLLHIRAMSASVLRRTEPSSATGEALRGAEGVRGCDSFNLRTGLNT